MTKLTQKGNDESPRAALRERGLMMGDATIATQELFIAVLNSSPKDVRRALDAGADPLFASSEGMTALMLSVNAIGPNCLETLLPVSDAKARNRIGRDALMISCETARPKLALMLLPHSDAWARNEAGESALLICSNIGLGSLIAPLAAVSDPLARDAKGRSAAELAREAGLPDEAEMLLSLQLAAELKASLAPGQAQSPPGPRSL